MQKTRLRSSRR